jgi:hypothetical protein
VVAGGSAGGLSTGRLAIVNRFSGIFVLPIRWRGRFFRRSMGLRFADG